MIDYKLANILIAPDEFSASYPGLYWRDGEGKAAYAKEEAALEISGTVDFTTYLNGLSIEKWHRYTVVTDVTLELQLSGDACEVYATGLSAGMKAPKRSERPILKVGASEGIQVVEVPLPKEHATIQGFAIHSEGTTKLAGGCYLAEVDEDVPRPVRLALATTTFKKEAYITRNIAAVKKEVLGSKDPIASGFHMFVIDNGRTLDAEELSDEGVTVIPNANVGGSGGFARGMIAGLDWNATHVLLMDDDVRVLPESFKRTYALLSLANERYQDAFINGAMLNIGQPNIQFEDVAQVGRDGRYRGIKDTKIEVDTYEGIAHNESINVEVPRAYGAWWYSCIPTKAIRKNGLPLPVFVRCDDVEYGIRCQPKYMAMDGICVWHEQFEGRFRASVDCYQYTRNFMIMMAVDELPYWRTFMMRFDRTFHIYLRAMDYEACELLLDGLEDYLKGPTFIETASGEDIIKRQGAKNEKLLPISELSEEDQEACKEAPASSNPWVFGEGARRHIVLKLAESVPHDRHDLPDWMLDPKPVAVNYSHGAYPSAMTARHSVLVAYDIDGTHAHVRRMDRKRWQDLKERYRTLMADYATRGDAVAKAYHEAKSYLTSTEFWKSYLHMDA